MQLWLGIFLLLSGVLALLFHLRTSYLTHGGALGQVPVLAAAALQVPMLLLFGIGLIDGAPGRLGLWWWHYLLIAVILVLGCGRLTIWIGELGARNQRERETA